MNERRSKTGETPPSRGRDRARALRRAATEAERKLWWHLRRKLPLEGTYFRRQVPLGPYFADFACLKYRLVIELDGGQHTTPDGQRRDAERTAFLEAQGFRVLRFWNEQVFSRIDSVIDTIHAAIEGAQTLTPCPSPQGRGESEAETLARALLERLAANAPPNVALMHLLMRADSPEAAGAALDEARRRARTSGVERVDAAAALLRANPESWHAVRAVTSSVAHQATAPSAEGALAYWTDAFDRLAKSAPEAGVALYALGNPDLLAAATAEVVESLSGWSVIGPETEVLDLGCGIGRFAEALAPRVGSVLGLDLSGAMIAEARRRCTRPNVRFVQGSGRDLAGAETAGFDLVLAADVFPYLVQAGGTLVDGHLRETRRVLRPGGGMVILNYSYRGDADVDRSDVTRLSQAHAFDVLRLGTQEFRLWDAAVFHLVRKE